MALLPYFTIRGIQAGDTVFRQGDDDYDTTILLVRGTLLRPPVRQGLCRIGKPRSGHSPVADNS